MATCGPALRGTGRAMAGACCWRRPSARLKGVSSLHRWLIDGFWYCEDTEREQVLHPRLDVLFLKTFPFNSSEYGFKFILMFSSLGSTVFLLNPPLFPPFPQPFPANIALLA